MARGWESKAVEDQIRSAEEKRTHTGPPLSEQQRATESQRAVLRLSRRKTLADLEHARDDRHKAALKQALAYLDAQIEALEQ